MNASRPQSAAGSSPSSRAALSPEAGARRADSSSSQNVPSPRKPVGYGLPCATCHLYFPADLNICPTCNGKERVPAVVPKIPPKTAQSTADPTPHAGQVEQERENFLRQFKSQLVAAHAGAANSSAAVCSFTDQHPGEPETAEVCKHCHDRLQERVDVCQGALHMDVKEATQIIYEAVWADSSDPGKTYGQAASALLTELRRRAGIATVLGPFQPPSD